MVSGNDNEQIVTGEVERLAGFYPALKLLAAIYVIFLLFLTFKQVLFWQSSGAHDLHFHHFCGERPSLLAGDHLEIVRRYVF